MEAIADAYMSVPQCTVYLIRCVYAQHHAKETRGMEWSGHNLTPNAYQGISPTGTERIIY